MSTSELHPQGDGENDGQQHLLQSGGDGSKNQRRGTSSSRFTDLTPANDGKHLRFTVQDVSLAVVNALRRSIIAHVQSAAFDFVQHPSCTGDVSKCGIRILRNTSPIYNEMLAKRLALVPVCADESKLYKLEADPSEYRFRIHVTNASQQALDVTSAHIQVVDREGKEVSPEERESLFPACPVTGDHVLLTQLKPNPFGDVGELHVECMASVKTGEEHARWSPVSACYFTNKIDKDAADAAYRLVADKTSRKNFDALEGMRYYHKNEYGEANVFDFRIESECGLRAAFLVFRGFRVLTDRISKIRQAIETRDVDKVDIDIAPVDSVPLSSTVSIESGNGQGKHDIQRENDGIVYDIRLNKEDHTCGNLIQALIYQFIFRDDHRQDASPSSSKRPIDYVGYHQPHPLEHYIIIRVKVADPNINIESFLIASLKRIEELLKDHTEQWIDAADMRNPKHGYNIDNY